MLGLCIKNYVTTNAKRTLRDFKSAYTFNSQGDGDAMFFVILKMVRPDTRTGCSDIKYNLENMNISHLKDEIPKSNIFKNCEPAIDPLLNLIMNNLQGLHGEQEEWVGGG